MTSAAIDRISGTLTSTAVKAPVVAVSLSNLTLAGLQTVGGVALSQGDRVLVAGQTSAVNNGIYLANSSDWQRSADFDGARDVVTGTLVVLPVSTGAGAVYQLYSTDDPIIIGTSYLYFTARVDLIEPMANPVDVRTLGIIPNDPSRATTNTTILKAFVNPTLSVFSGNLLLPPIIGADVYYFNDLIDFHDGIRIDLCGCQMHFAKAAAAGDVNAGFITAIRDFGIENGSIVVNYDGGGVANRGNALMFGWRDSTTHFPNSYDSLLATPMGNITVRNLRITSNTPLSRACQMLGGLQNVVFENIVIDGQSALGGGIGYEYGWATNETNREDRQTSHANGLIFNNITVKNLGVALDGVALSLTAVYNASVTNLKGYGVIGVFAFTPGESLFYRPWANHDGAGAKHNLMLRNITGAPTGTAISVLGAQASTGYLAPLSLPVSVDVDLIEFSLDGFAFSGTTGGVGVYTSAGKADIRNGTVTGFSVGLMTTQECTHPTLYKCNVFDSDTFGIEIGQAVGFYSPLRPSIGSIRECFIAGSGHGTPSAAIVMANTQDFVVELNRFGYSMAHDSKTETTQLQAATLGADCFNVALRSNHVAATSASAPAYSLASALSSSRGCTIEKATGVVTSTGIFENTLLNQISADKGDADSTYQAHRDPSIQYYNTPLTGDRAVILATTNAVDGDSVTHIRSAGASGAHTLTVGSAVIPNSTKASVTHRFKSGAWIQERYGVLA